MTTYRIIRFFKNSYDKKTIKTGLTLEEAQEHCGDPETSSSTCRTAKMQNLTARLGPWFDGYDEE
jgi:hypothetical protein